MMYIYSARLLLAACVFAFSFSVMAQNENPFIGTWDLDKAKSNFGGAPVPEQMSRTYQDMGGGGYMYFLVIENQDGSIGGSSATYKYDSQEFPMASLNQTIPTTIAYTLLGNRKTVEYRVRVGGDLSQIGAKTISPDGKVLTIVIQNLNSEGGINSNQVLRFNKR